MEARSNFGFLASQDERLARLGALAERYFSSDAPGALFKLRQLGEFIAKDVAGRHGLLPTIAASFDDVLRTLRLKSILPREVADLFFHLKRLGNAAAHEDAGTAGEALEALKIARPRSQIPGSDRPRPSRHRQALIHRIFDDPDAKRPTPGTYDLIIVDEAPRGYGCKEGDPLVSEIATWSFLY
jgi:Domain of unknown function (DUF4145)